MTNQQMQKRNKTIALMAVYDNDVNLTDIGIRYGLSRERVRQILKELGIEYGDIRVRLRIHRDAYKEAIRKTKAYFITISADGKQRPEYCAYVNMLRRCFQATLSKWAKKGGRPPKSGKKEAK